MGVVTLCDLFCLWCMATKQPCNLLMMFAVYFSSMSQKSRGALYGGSYITRLARYLHVLDTPSRLTQVGNMLPLDLEHMTRLGMVHHHQLTGAYVLIDQPGDDSADEAETAETDEPARGEEPLSKRSADEEDTSRERVRRSSQRVP